MAAINSFADDLKAQLTCVICNDIFKEPKTLPCLHTFCFNCIKDWNDTCQRERQPLKCPTCRAAVKVEDGDVSKLPSSFAHNSLLQLFQSMKVTSDDQQLPECISCGKRKPLTADCQQCEGMICGVCFKLHKTMKTLKRTHEATLLSEFKRQNVNSYINNKSLCKEKFHEECRLEYCCKTGRTCVCHKCAATAQSSHHKVSIEEAAEDAKELIGDGKQQLEELLVQFQKDLDKCSEAFRDSQYGVEAAKDKVRYHARAMLKILQDHENAVIAALDSKLERQRRVYEEEQREVHTKIYQITQLKKQCEAIENEQSAHYVLEGYENLITSVQLQSDTSQSKESI